MKAVRVAEVLNLVVGLVLPVGQELLDAHADPDGLVLVVAADDSRPSDLRPFSIDRGQHEW